MRPLSSHHCLTLRSVLLSQSGPGPLQRLKFNHMRGKGKGKDGEEMEGDWTSAGDVNVKLVSATIVRLRVDLCLKKSSILHHVLMMDLPKKLVWCVSGVVSFHVMQSENLCTARLPVCSGVPSIVKEWLLSAPCDCASTVGRRHKEAEVTGHRVCCFIVGMPGSAPQQPMTPRPPLSNKAVPTLYFAQDAPLEHFHLVAPCRGSTGGSTSRANGRNGKQRSS